MFSLRAARTLRPVSRTFSSAASNRLRSRVGSVPAIPHAAHRAGSSSAWVVGSAFVISASAALAWNSRIHLDAAVTSVGDFEKTRVDPATSIAFPETLRISSKTPLPTFTLVGVGVRTVSFLGMKVYSVGFYADLTSPGLAIPKDASPEEKIEYIARNRACVLRIVPTRSTSYSHLRDGFMRAFQARQQLCRQRGELTPEEELSIQSPLRTFKSMFPNTAISKGTPLDILVTAPSPKQPRTLVVRDLGSIQSDWVSREFILAYFEGAGLSPPMKQSVIEYVQALP